MRNILLISGLLFFFSCNNNTAGEKEPVVKGKSLVEIPVAAEKIAGTYVGDFKGSPIAITLSYVSNGRASGYNIHKGLKRNLSGTMELVNGSLHLALSEPGNNQFDGTFDLNIDTTSWKGQGKWKPLKKGDEVSFTFEKKYAIATEYEDPFNSIYVDDRQNSLHLKADGSCTYTYLSDTTNTGQEITIRGNYSMNRDSVVTIHWQNNEIFPSRKSIFKMATDFPMKDSDFNLKVLKGEGSEFSQLMY